MSAPIWDGSAEPVSRDQILRRKSVGKIHSLLKADHEQNWQPLYRLMPNLFIFDDRTHSILLVEL